MAIVAAKKEQKIIKQRNKMRVENRNFKEKMPFFVFIKKMCKRVLVFWDTRYTEVYEYSLFWCFCWLCDSDILMWEMCNWNCKFLCDFVILQIEFDVNMTCGSCEDSIKKALSQVDGIQNFLKSIF